LANLITVEWVYEGGWYVQIYENVFYGRNYLYHEIYKRLGLQVQIRRGILPGGRKLNYLPGGSQGCGIISVRTV
jgi:hypothetical protein